MDIVGRVVVGVGILAAIRTGEAEIVPGQSSAEH